jgi:hypothetical protein
VDVDGAQASCVAPQLSAGVSSAPAGDVVEIRGELHAGPATIRVQSETFTELAFTVAPATDASTSPTTDSVSTSTSAAVAATVGSTTPPSDEDGDSNWPWISAVIGLGLVLAMLVVTRVRTRRQRSIPDEGEDRLN